MRCYLTTDGRYVATQAEAGDGFSKIEWPDDKPGQLAAINALVDQIRAERAPIEIVGVPAETITANAPPPVQPSPTPAAHIATLTDAETVIQAADHRQLCSLTENVILRMRELAKAAGQ